MNKEIGSIYAYLIDQRTNTAHAVSWQEIRVWRPENEYLWLVSRADGMETRRWLQNESGLDPQVLNVLFSDDNRPHVDFSPEGTLISLRAVNQDANRESDEDLVCVNMWVDQRRFIVLRSHATLACSEVRNELKEGNVPNDTGEIFAMLMDRLMSRMDGLLNEMDHQIDELEDRILVRVTDEVQMELATLRHRVITARRYLVAQHNTLSSLYGNRAFWLSDTCRRTIRESNSHVNRAVEDINACRERALFLQDQITNLNSNELNKTMKILTAFTAVLLPLNAFTSLMGTNVEGIPGQAGTTSPNAFTYEVLICIGIVGACYHIFKRLKWFE
ncbi:MAG: hypothetical protein HQM03_14660 [Magnetococcales bacterium]|nr:hypothetical protein [Magnetococcales bacterium]